MCIRDSIEGGSFIAFTRKCLKRVLQSEIEKRDRVRDREISSAAQYETSTGKDQLTHAQVEMSFVGPLSKADCVYFFDALPRRDGFGFRDGIEFLMFEGLYVRARQVEATDSRWPNYWFECVAKYGETMQVAVPSGFSDIQWSEMPKTKCFQTVAQLLSTSPASRRNQKEKKLTDQQVVEQLKNNLSRRFFRKRLQIYIEIPSVKQLLSEIDRT